jgi:hypothetical protein
LKYIKRDVDVNGRNGLLNYELCYNNGRLKQLGDLKAVVSGTA